MPNLPKACFFLLLFFPILALPVCAGGRLDPAAEYNVILVSLDALRPDHLGCYGYSRDTSPHLDSIAKQGLLFKNAFAQGNFTLSSHGSLFTSKYPHSHNADRIERRLADNEATIAEVMKANGYKTAAFIHNAQQFDPKFGLDQGFETYDFSVETDRRPSFARTVPACLEWINRHKTEKFFVFLHSNDIHEPYHCPDEDHFDPDYKGRLDNEYMATWPPGFHEKNLRRTSREIRHITAHYDAGIRYADAFVGKLIASLSESGLLKKTILVFFSDHGEILGDRGKRFCHGFGLHDEEVRVALLFYLPGSAKQVIDQPAQLIDVMPTILELLSINKDKLSLEGKSLAGAFAGGNNADNELNEYIYAESLSGESDSGGPIDMQAMIRSRRWKLITHTWKLPKDRRNIRGALLHNGAIITPPFTDRIELYDLEKDPGELNNLADKGYADIQDRLLSKLLSFF